MNKETEQYIEHEVKIRLLEAHKDDIYKRLEKADARIESRFLVIIGLLIGSFFAPAVLHSFHLL